MSDGRPTFAERLADPLSHFPYKHEDAHAGRSREVRRQARLLELPEDIEQRLVEALSPFAIDEVDATAAYVAAQEAYLRSPSDETRADERDAADVLTAARWKLREMRPLLIAQARREQEG